MFKKGFTLVEVLIAILIMAILVTMAVPMYEKTIEKSRLAETRVLLKKIAESKVRVMDNLGIIDYNMQFGMNQLDVDLDGSKSGIKLTTKDFTYSLLPSSFANAVCATRRKGDNKDVSFLFLGEVATQICTCPASAGTICGEFCTNGTRFFCGGDNTKCDAYSMDNMGGPWCTND